MKASAGLMAILSTRAEGGATAGAAAAMGGAGVEAGKEAAIAPVAVVTRSTAWAYCCKKWRGRRRMLR